MESVPLRDHVPRTPVQRHRVGQRAVAIKNKPARFKMYGFHFRQMMFVSL
jgi:hypothetical protein